MLIIVCIPAKSRKTALTAALVMRWSCRKEEKPRRIQKGDNNRRHHDFYTSSCCATQHWSWREGPPAVNHRRHSGCSSWKGLGQDTSPPTPSNCPLQLFLIILTSAALWNLEVHRYENVPTDNSSAFLSERDQDSDRAGFVTMSLKEEQFFKHMCVIYIYGDFGRIN